MFLYYANKESDDAGPVLIKTKIPRFYLNKDHPLPTI